MAQIKSIGCKCSLIKCCAAKAHVRLVRSSFTPLAHMRLLFVRFLCSTSYSQAHADIFYDNLNVS